MTSFFKKCISVNPASYPSKWHEKKKKKDLTKWWSHGVYDIPLFLVQCSYSTPNDEAYCMKMLRAYFSP